MRITRAVILSTVVLLGTGAGAVSRADVATTIPVCNGCHGAQGVSPIPGVPTIAGLSALVIENALDDYRAGSRPCPTIPDAGTPGLNMCVPAMAIAEADLAGIAAHLSALPFQPKAQQTDPDLVARGKAVHEAECEICHTQGGGNPADDASILAGQDIGYLRHSLTEYAAAARVQPRPMEAKIMRLGPDDIEALAQFYASEP